MSGATGTGSATTGAKGARGSAADSAARAADAEGTTEGKSGGTSGAVTEAGAADAAGGPKKRQQQAQGQPSKAAEKERPVAGKGNPQGPQAAGTGAREERTAPGATFTPPQAYGAPGPRVPGVGPDAGPRVPAPSGARLTPRTRKARLRVAKMDPWSVMKVSFLLSIALGICTIVAAAVLWMVMDAMGVFATVGGTISEATGSNESNGFDLQSFLSLPRVLTFTSVIAVIDVVLMTALATLGSFIYNLSAGFVGGVELTLAEDE
ncbi:DUF3566 domain-containing protein [Streptomyces sp. BI20]|uniref:DUF3566 domain-containing protein n=1 Tax=Streptomyces sp. BI20 TaxID=3403460 RepID=UPI003C732F96